MKAKCSLPMPVERPYKPLRIDGPGKWLVLSDVHIPYHDVLTVELAIERARRERAAGVLLNGDILDCYSLSSFDHDPSLPRMAAEIESGKSLLAYIRERLPHARIVYKEGNHEERLTRYIMRHADSLFGLDCVTMPRILDLKGLGVEWVGDKRLVRLGMLNVLHGHEYRPSIAAPVNPARGLFLRSKTVALCGHWHQTSEHHEPTLEGKPKGCWSTGCACNLSPAYSPFNKWNHGFAVVEIAKDGKFSVRNMRVLNGEIV